MEIPEGFTDDMTVTIRPGRSLEELAATVMAWLLERRDLNTCIPALQKDFGLSEEDALLALDRIQGGIVRALTGNPENEPNSVKDPLAWTSFTTVWKELPKTHLFSRQKKPSGRWNDWYQSRKK